MLLNVSGDTLQEKKCTGNIPISKFHLFPKMLSKSKDKTEESNPTLFTGRTNSLSGKLTERDTNSIAKTCAFLLNSSLTTKRYIMMWSHSYSM